MPATFAFPMLVRSWASRYKKSTGLIPETYKERKKVEHGHDGEDPYVQLAPNDFLQRGIDDGFVAADAARVDMFFGVGG